MARSAKSRAQRARLVRQWQTSGGSQAAFARRHGVHPRTFWGWVYASHLGLRSPAEAPRFLPVQVVRPAAPAAREIETGHQILVSVDRPGVLSAP